MATNISSWSQSKAMLFTKKIIKANNVFSVLWQFIYLRQRREGEKLKFKAEYRSIYNLAKFVHILI